MYRAAILCGLATLFWVSGAGALRAQQVFRRGDADGNGRLELTDGVRVLRFLFVDSEASPLPCKDAGDADDSGTLALTDGVRILRFLFIDSTTNPIPPPGPANCGPDPSADGLPCASYAGACEPLSGPLLVTTPGTLEFTGGETVELSLRNAGEGTLEWTVASGARWLRNGDTSIVEAPLSSAAANDGVAAGQSISIPLTAVTAGLPLGTTDGEVTVSSNGGAVTIPARVTVTELDLSGLWVGTFVWPEGSLLPTPGIALDVEQSGGELTATIDGRLAPAFATAIRRQAHDVSFRAAEGSVARGALEVTAVPEDAPVEIWTLAAENETSFAVGGSSSGPQGSAPVGQPFTTAAGVTLLVSAPWNGRSYQVGDRFEFRIGSYGFADGVLAGSVAGSLSGAFALDPDLSGVRPGVSRTVTFSAFDIVEPNVLEADLEIRHAGLLMARDVVTSGAVRLSRRQ